MPNLGNDPIFFVFFSMITLSLLSLVCSRVMFLSIFTSRFSEYDFFIVLVVRLIIGLRTLFFAILCMWIAFGTALHLVFGFCSIVTLLLASWGLAVYLCSSSCAFSET
ncbi:hypothetical protein RHMOL_Rhmol07G0147300 [Rhododendron molle]|uniref:Uncharacterized protein n=1 Tax=Rhododendron molle TaxID=49168 RepID=A0ACC0N234_RHOML|nr:hypothetical protein RHMOL_Rhmol07G0147300 [Rhododendron molle]